MPQIIYAAAALRDIDRLRAFLRPKNPSAARRAGEAIRNGLRILETQPRLGRPVEDLPEPYREWVIEFAFPRSSGAISTSSDVTTSRCQKPSPSANSDRCAILIPNGIYEKPYVPWPFLSAAEPYIAL